MMSRRLETRLTAELPITLNLMQGIAAVEGFIRDISATHFRANFQSEISASKRYGFQILLPNQQQIRGEAVIEQSHVPSQSGDYVFVIENLPVDEERILVECIQKGNESLALDRRNGHPQSIQIDRRFVAPDYAEIKKRRVVITGIGVVAPNAIGRVQFWKAIQEKKSGVRQIKGFDCSQFPVRIGGEIDDEALAGLVPPKKVRRMGRVTLLGWIASKLAIEDAQLDLSKVNLDSVGVAMGTTLGPLDWAYDQYAAQTTKGYRAEHPYMVAGSANAVSGEISVEYGFRGPSFTISQGCSSGSIAIANGLDLIQAGKAETMLVGGSEAPLNPTVFGAFIKSGILSLRFPFWEDNVIKRDGCVGSVLSEGACVLVLESYDRAIHRGAPIFGEILSSGVSSDGYDMVVPHPSGRGVAMAIRQAVRQAGIKTEDIDLVIGHFPGVKGIYDVEMRALRREFGKRFQDMPITNVKPLIGYTQGACAPLELAAACQTFHEAVQLVTYGTTHPPIKSKCTLINCIGFGGKNAALIVKAYEK